MKVLILSDIHGNFNALEAVLANSVELKPDALLLLGDLIDYGGRSNEVISLIKSLNIPIKCNILGNHENAIIKDQYECFSSDRGRVCAKHTRLSLNSESWDYLLYTMMQQGKSDFFLADKYCLAVHGSLNDEFWKSISHDSDLTEYKKFDIVFSGHSHLPHFFEHYYKTDNLRTRNKKKTIFINPGSVGQPRNLNNKAQFAFLDTDTEEVILKKINYDIQDEQKYIDDTIDEFYKNRLKDGI